MSADNTNNSKTVLVAASGSGGHLMPAKLLCDALTAEGFAVEFVGSGRPLEQEIFGELGFPLHEIHLTGLNKLGVVGAAKFFAKLPGALLQTRRLFKTVNPTAVIGVGGYASVLPVVFASFKGLPAWIHEAELSPGNANRFLTRFATRISVAFEETSAFPAKKQVFTGHPLREDVAALADQSLEVGEPKKILILGGSQGARALDDAFFELAHEVKDAGFELHHQCRPENQERLRERYKEVGIASNVESFIHSLGQAYSDAHLIVARAGAGTVMEIGVVNKPTIFVPFPHAQGRHQHKNAETLTAKGKAFMVEEGEHFASRLWDQLEYLARPEEFQKMLGIPRINRPLDAASRIASGVRELIES